MIFQNPMSSLNPVWPIGDQIAERPAPASRHRAAQQRADGRHRRCCAASASPAPEQRVDDYPHQWSGGMMQRAVIAMAMAGAPRLMLADEPTTALDVTIQDQILSLLMELQRETGMALVLVSHDMGVIAETCDRVAVMYAGRIVELAPTAAIFEAAGPSLYATGCCARSRGSKGEAGARRRSPASRRISARRGQAAPSPSAARWPAPNAGSAPIALRQVGPDHATACLFPERVADPRLERAMTAAQRRSCRSTRPGRRVRQAALAVDLAFGRRAPVGAGRRRRVARRSRRARRSGWSARAAAARPPSAAPSSA